MSQPLVVVSSDNHNEPCAWTGRPELSGDSYFAFQQTIDYCVAADLPLILAGDVFDKPYPDAYSTWFVVEQLDRVKRGVVFIQGQHELSRSKPWLSLSFATTHLHKGMFTLGGLNFYGLDFLPAAELKQELALIPAGTDVLVAHQVWLERMGALASPEAAFVDVPKVRCIITGDFHGHCQDNFAGKDGQNILVVSPGSQCVQSITEDPRKYFYVMHDDLTFESIPLKSREWLRFTLRNPQSFEHDLAGVVADIEYQKGVPDAIAKPAFIVEFNPDIPDARKRLRAALADKVHLFDRPLEAKPTRDQFSETTTAPAESGLGPALEQLRCNLPEVYSTAKRLLEAKEPKEELTQILREAMEAGPVNPFAPATRDAVGE